MLPQCLEAAALCKDKDADGYVDSELQCDEAVNGVFPGSRGGAEDAQHVKTKGDATEEGSHETNSVTEV